LRDFRADRFHARFDDGAEKKLMTITAATIKTTNTTTTPRNNFLIINLIRLKSLRHRLAGKLPPGSTRRE